MNIDALLEQVAPVVVRTPCPFTEDTRGRPKVAHCCDGYGNPSDTGAFSRCGAHWPNRDAISHCPTCHVTFASIAAFDAHRVGEHGAKTCLGVDVMVEKQWQRTPGVAGMADTWSKPKVQR